VLYIFLAESPKMTIINLNCLVSGSSENETFTIEISNDKKYELLKHMVKKCLAPLFDSIPSTQITLRLSANTKSSSTISCCEDVMDVISSVGDSNKYLDSPFWSWVES
ncbi:36609_t:CDS:2, partial [Racocetra persica]